jgi:hypothetical protein
MRVKLLRMLVAFAMALLLPLQGMAAVSAGLCMELGGHESVAVHEHGAGHHGAAHQHGTDESAADHHDDEGAGNEGPAGNPHCPPCVACCAAAAISSFTPVFIAQAAAASVIAEIPPSFSGVQPETLDRPPLAL